MREYIHAIRDLLEEVGDAFEEKIEDFTKGENFVSFKFAGVGMDGFFVKQENGSVAIRFYYAIDNVRFSYDDGERLLPSFEIMNRYNLVEGGVTQLVFLDDEENSEFELALKSFDVALDLEKIDQDFFHNIIIGLIADVLSVCYRMESIEEIYIDSIAEL